MASFVKNFKISKLENSKFIKPFKLELETQKGTKIWDCAELFDSVAALLYHKEKDAFVIVKQFRPAIWHKLHKDGLNLSEMGFTYELCAGLMDKNKSETQTIKEEILEETGYLVDKVEKITSVYGALGFGGHRQSIFFAAIDESMRVGSGGGVDDEDIEVVFLPVDRAFEFMFNENIVKASGILFAMMWFFDKFKR